MVKHGLTSYPDVNEVVIHLLTEVQKVLGDQFVGLYLYGSLSSGDFHPEAGDIDFLIVTENFLSDETVEALDAIQRRIWETGLKWAGKLDSLPQ